jgi:hypothetical protein
MLDFNRSFLTFTTLDRGNTARIQIEGRCTLSPVSGGPAQRYVLIAACKAEDTYGAGSLFKQPNYDFSGLFSESDYALYRHFPSAQDNQPESGPLGQLFAGIEIQEASLAAARALPTTAEIIAATLAGLPLCARTLFGTPDGRFKATLDYPIKTINVNQERQRFQVDTGPLPFPCLTGPAERLAEIFVPAFVAYQALDRAEFIIQEPVELAGRAVTVNHYSSTYVVAAETTLFAAE